MRPLVTPHFVYLLDDSSGEDCELYHDLASEVLIRKPMLWSTVLWLYPGVYEVRKAKSSKEADPGMNPETQPVVEEVD
ncbi:hypothetical protein BHE74_00047972 [Ensete ventricosum]|nr:hypothetical protein BHE74_00047972 [Ensete ventricosum]